MSPSDQVLAAWQLEKARLSPIASGLINTTFLVENERVRFILQKLSPIFDKRVHFDIDRVTRQLENKGLTTPRLIPTKSDNLFFESAQGDIWRLQTHIAGTSLRAFSNAQQVQSAASFLGEFHTALSDLDYNYQATRLGVHDSKAHATTLTNAVATHRDHPRYETIAPLAEELLQQFDDLEGLPEHPSRHVHGDPKTGNFIFDTKKERAVALVDLDTVGKMPLLFELGDAMRSWCAEGQEDASTLSFSSRHYKMAVEAYRRSASFLDPGELDALYLATLTIILELALRFCADALNESYFGWDKARFASASHHNETRARSQLSLFRSARKQRF